MRVNAKNMLAQCFSIDIVLEEKETSDEECAD